MTGRYIKLIDAYFTGSYILVCFLLFTGNLLAQDSPVNSSVIIPDFKTIPQIKWEFKTNEPIFSSPVVDANLVYFGGLDSLLYAIDIQTGIEKWRFRTQGEIRSNVCIDDDKLYLNGGDGNLYSLNKNSGKLLWSFRTKGERKYDFADYFTSTPILKNKILYFGSGDGNMYAVNCDSGTSIWSFKAGNIIRTTARSISAQPTDMSMRLI